MNGFMWVVLGLALAGGGAFVGRMAFLAANPPEIEGDKPRKRWTTAWVIWLFATLLGFVVIEGSALSNSSGGDTLTEQIQYIAGLSPFWTVVVSGGVVAFFSWFLYHLFNKDSRVWLYLKRRPK